jgi:hypothetical protein
MLQVKLKQRLLAWWRKEELREVEYEERVQYCELKQGLILREEEYAYERLDESLMDYWESSNQHKKMMKKSVEARERYFFKTNNLCMVVGFAGD